MLILRTAAADSTTWNPVDRAGWDIGGGNTQTVLSNNNMTTQGLQNATPYWAARSTSSRRPGRWYFEGVTTWGYLGVGTGAAALNSISMAGCLDWTNNITQTGLRVGNTTSIYPALINAATDRVAYAVINQGPALRRFWMRNLTTGGQWILNSSNWGGDPANDIGGDDVIVTGPFTSGLDGEIFLMGASGWGGLVTIYPSVAAGGIGPPPTGFRWWDR